MKPALLKAILAFTIWGLFPIYFDELGHIDSFIVVLYRIVFCFVFSFFFIALFRKFSQFKKLTFTREHIKKIFLAGLLISSNWFIFIYAVSINEVLETSLGYFIAPLISIFIGIFFLKEKVGRSQKIAIFFLLLAIGYKIYIFGQLPWISLALALSFAGYGLIKKKIPFDTLSSFGLETLFILPLGILVFIIWFIIASFSSSNVLLPSMLFFSSWEILLLVGQGLISVVPLLLFASSVKKLNLSSIGYVNFITPSISFLLGIFYFKEKFIFDDLIIFSFIWLALFIINIRYIPFFEKNF